MYREKHSLCGDRYCPRLQASTGGLGTAPLWGGGAAVLCFPQETGSSLGLEILCFFWCPPYQLWFSLEALQTVTRETVNRMKGILWIRNQREHYHVITQDYLRIVVWLPVPLIPDIIGAYSQIEQTLLPRSMASSVSNLLLHSFSNRQKSWSYTGNVHMPTAHILRLSNSLCLLFHISIHALVYLHFWMHFSTNRQHPYTSPLNTSARMSLRGFDFDLLRAAFRFLRFWRLRRQWLRRDGKLNMK